MKKNYTNEEKIRGELAVRGLSGKAQSIYNGTDDITAYEYIDMDATAAAEADAFENDVDFGAGELDVIRYDVRGAFNASGLSFDELQAFLEGIADQLAACGD